MRKPVERALFLVGSVRSRSNSAGLAKGLSDLLAASGVSTETMRLIPENLQGNKWQSLLAAWDQANLIVLSFPLYVDSLPSYVIKAMEMLAEQRLQSAIQGKHFAVICNCGFPEAKQVTTALSVCRIFADQIGLNWLGSLPQGGGEALNGNSPQALGGMMRYTTQALALAAEALASGEPIPAKAVEYSSKPILPSWAFRPVGSWSFRQQAKKNGVLGQIRDRPYA